MRLETTAVLDKDILLDHLFRAEETLIFLMLVGGKNVYCGDIDSSHLKMLNDLTKLERFVRVADVGCAARGYAVLEDLKIERAGSSLVPKKYRLHEPTSNLMEVKINVMLGEIGKGRVVW